MILVPGGVNIRGRNNEDDVLHQTCVHACLWPAVQHLSRLVQVSEAITFVRQVCFGLGFPLRLKPLLLWHGDDICLVLTLPAHIRFNEHGNQ